MADSTVFESFMKGLEGKIEKKIGSHPGYKQVKAALEKKGERPDPRTLIMDSRAMFSGENKPAFLVLEAMTYLEKQVETTSGEMVEFIDMKRMATADIIEKNMAILENRPSKTIHKVEKSEALFTGRLLSEDDGEPVSGARVVIREAVSISLGIVAVAVTDANGEYVVRMDKKAVSAAPETLTLFFETPDGKRITKKKKLFLPRTLGKVKEIFMSVADNKRKLADDMVKKTEERKHLAALELAELRRSGAELNLHRFQITKFAGDMNAKLDWVKELFNRT